MAGAGAGAGPRGRAVAGSSSSSSHSIAGLWSYTPSYCPSERPGAAVLHSISTHVPLRSITAVPCPAPPSPPAERQQLQPPALAPFTAYEVTGTRRAARQHQLQHQHIQQQQNVLEQLLHEPEDAAGIAGQQQQQQQPQQQQQQQQQQLGKSELAAWERLVAAGKWRLRLDCGELQPLLHQLQPVLPALKPGQLAHAAHAVSVLPNGAAAAAAAVPAWQLTLLAAAAELFAAGRMDDWASSVLLQALARLQAQPGPAWLHAACAGMDVLGWDSSRALATVAACLPQLGHVPDSSWAASYFAATATKLHAMPAVSLARMLHGVVAWHHLQLQQQQQQEGQEEALVLPEQWVCRVLQELHACSSALRPCEVAMVLQTLTRLQAPGFLPCCSSSSSSSTVTVGQQPQSQLQVCMQQLLHALVPAVARRRHDFGSQDLAVVLHSMALLQQQAQQPEQQLCIWEWLELVLPAVQAHLQDANARTQTTTLWAAAALMQPHLQRQQEQEQQQQQQRQLTPAVNSLPQRQQQAATDAQVTPSDAGTSAAQQAQQYVRGQRPVVRPVWQGSSQQQQQQAAAAASISQAVTATSAAAAAAGGAGSQPTGGSSLQSALEALKAPPVTATPVTTPAAAAAVSVPDAAGVWLSWLDSFYTASLPRLHTLSGQDLVVAACTLAVQQQVPPVAWYEQLLSAIHSRLANMTQGQLSGVAWALGRMALLPCRHNPLASLVPLQPWLHALYSHTVLLQTGPVGAATAAEVVRLMWAAAVCDYDPGDDWWQAAEQLLLTPAHPAGGTGGSRTLQAQQQQQVAVQLLPARLLGVLLQAYAGSGRRLPGELLQAVTTPAVCQQLCAEPVANTLRVVRGLLHSGSPVPQQWLQDLADGFQSRLGLLSAQELGHLMLGLADAGLQGPGTSPPSLTAGQSTSSSSSWGAALARALDVQLPHLTTSDVCRLLWGAAKLRLDVPPATKQALLREVQAGFLDASPSALAVSIDAITRLGVAPSRDWLGGLLMATHRTFTAAAASAAAAGGDDLSSRASSIRARLVLVAAILQTLQGLARLQPALPAKWLKQQLLLLHGQLPLLQPRHIASLLLLLARLKCRPSPTYLNSILGQLGDCSSCNAQDLAQIAYGIASLRWQPRKAWMSAFLAASGRQLSEMSDQGLALTHWALAVTRVTPPALTWRAEAVRVVAERLGRLDARQLSMIVWAWGRLQVHLTPQQQQQPAGVPAALQGAPQPYVMLAMQQQQQVGQQPQAVAGAGQPALSAYWQQRRQLAQQLLAAALSLCGQFTAVELTHLLAGLAKMRLYPSQAWLSAMLHTGGVGGQQQQQQQQQRSVPGLDGYQTQQLLWALAVLRYRPPVAWVDSMGVLLETKWQANPSTRASAEWALRQLRMLAADAPTDSPSV